MFFSNLRIRRRSAWLEAPFQLGVAIIMCVVLPFASYTATLQLGWNDPVARNTALVAFGALAFGFWLHRSVSALPGARESAGILPGYVTSFGTVLTLILLFRMHYSRAILISSFSLAVFWFFLVYLVTQRHSALHLGIVAGGRVDQFASLASVVCSPVDIDEWPHSVDAITADFGFGHSDAWEARLADYVLAGIPVYHSKDLLESLTGLSDLEHLSENNLGTLGPLATFQSAKQAIDIFLAIPAIIVASPIFVIAALAIKLDSRGPVFFRQRRVGYRGVEFTVLKFRTMIAKPGTSARDAFITQEGDVRITGVGRFLRRTRIDELPQIINILRRQMSWIGPRPEALALSAWYEAELPFYRYRHIVMPGITGWAQVSQGHVAELDDVRTKLKYDFYYIRNFSVWLDLLIIAKTIKTMLTGFGSR